jgi:hydroxypyruvate isomerase
MPGFFLDTSARVMQVIESVEADNVRLQYDVYHMQVMEGDLIRTMECLLPWISHIQIADNPGRHQPGSGEINFPQVFRALDRMGYQGWVGAEYRPAGLTSASLDWLRYPA